MKEYQKKILELINVLRGQEDPPKSAPQKSQFFQGYFDGNGNLRKQANILEDFSKFLSTLNKLYNETIKTPTEENLQKIIAHLNSVSISDYREFRANRPKKHQFIIETRLVLEYYTQTGEVLRKALLTDYNELNKENVQLQKELEKLRDELTSKRKLSEIDQTFNYSFSEFDPTKKLRASGSYTATATNNSFFHDGTSIESSFRSSNAAILSSSIQGKTSIASALKRDEELFEEKLGQYRGYTSDYKLRATAIKLINQHFNKPETPKNEKIICINLILKLVESPDTICILVVAQANKETLSDSFRMLIAHIHDTSIRERKSTFDEIGISNESKLGFVSLFNYFFCPDSHRTSEAQKEVKRRTYFSDQLINFPIDDIENNPKPRCLFREIRTLANTYLTSINTQDDKNIADRSGPAPK